MANLTALLAPSFYGLHQDVKLRRHSNYWLCGGRGSTKSSFVSIEIILGIMADPTHQSNAVVLRKVASTLRESVYDQYLWALDKLGVDGLWTTSLSPLMMTYVPTGQQIRFKGADKPEKIKSQKFRHGYIKYKHYEEVTGFNSFKEIRSINQSLNRGGSGIVTFYSFNPPSSSISWVNQATSTEGAREDTLVHHSDYRGVPPQWLGDEFLADARQLKKDNYTLYRHDYLGAVTGTGAEVFNNLTVRKIRDEEYQSLDTRFDGLDFGFSRDPLAYMIMGYDSARRRLFILKEFYKVAVTTRQGAEVIKKLNPDNREVVSDSAVPQTIAEYREMGINAVAAIKGPGSRDFEYKWLQDLREIIIDPTQCPNAAREFRSYELDQDSNGNFKAGYPDGNDHTIDATRYAMERVMRRRGYVPWED